MDNRPAVTFHTLGCKLNQAESEHLTRQFVEAGYRISTDDNADICVLNTCTVTHIADRKSRHILRLLRKRNPNALIVATGCYAERDPQKLMQTGIDLIVDNNQKMDLLKLIVDSLPENQGWSIDKSVNVGVGRARSFIKIQDGCNDYCTYCIVPFVRGRELCLPAEEIVNTIKDRLDTGYKEVILTGTKIGGYNHDGIDLKKLINLILRKTDIQRLHLSSLQPQEISNELLSLWQDSRLCRHFHIALQNGSETVLNRMGRRYSLSDYRKAISSIRQAISNPAITTDIMVGFPGESEQEFDESFQFCRDMNFAAMHVFSYSSRPGTLAKAMEGHIDDKKKKERSLRMLALAGESSLSFHKQFIGQIMKVLWENEAGSNSGIYTGLTDNYIRVYTYSTQPINNCIMSARLTKIYKQRLWGELII
jgi:threonylcarbamoyladenosine tRNA methylthiotransferase MtaB